MQSITIIFCDINGTLIGQLKNTDEDYRKFTNNLLSLKENDYSDKIIFSIISSEDSVYVKEIFNRLKSYLYGIQDGKQIFYDGYIENEKEYEYVTGKPFQILKYLSELSKTYLINRIYFIDDTLFYHEALYELIEDREKLVSIIPENNEGISELNFLLENLLEIPVRK